MKTGLWRKGNNPNLAKKRNRPPDGLRIAAGSNDGTMWVWRVPTAMLSESALLAWTLPLLSLGSLMGRLIVHRPE